MDLTGRIVDMSLDFTTRHPKIVLQLNEDATEGLQELSRLDKLTICIKKWRRKRSLDANAYYWALLTKMSGRLGTSKEELHNLMLSRYGQIDRDDEGNAIIFSLLSSIDISKRYDLHAKPVGNGTVNGKMFTHYVLLKGSHLYDTAEMSRLIDGAVGEAKELGIETLTPGELERMKSAWRPKEAG